jgi:hypothetical protein
VISQLKEKESEKRKPMDHSEIAEDDGIIQISQRFKKHPVFNSEPIRSQAQEPQQIIQNQETWLKAATVSMEDIGGRSTEGSFNSIQNMELKSSAIVNPGTKSAQAQELQRDVA